MYKRLLVPLDGSRLAESILPVAVFMTRSLKASVALIHVIEENPPEQVHGEQHLRDADQAEAYLHKIANEWFADVSTPETHVHSDKVKNVAQSILQHVGEFNSDLTLMCTHGRTGAREFLYGSIAQQIAAAAVPVLFVREHSDEFKTEFALRKLLVPLDGDRDHEQSIEVASELALACKCAISLLTIVPSLKLVSGSWTQSVRLLPSTTDRLLEMEVEEVSEYLGQQRRQLISREIAASAEVLRGDPAEEIINATTAQSIDLLVLGTHGTIGAQAFWSGSVAARVARKTVVPVLLVPARSK